MAGPTQRAPVALDQPEVRPLPHADNVVHVGGRAPTHAAARVLGQVCAAKPLPLGVVAPS